MRVCAGGAANGIAEFGRMRSCQADDGYLAAGQVAAGANADGGVRVEQVTGGGMKIVDGGQGLFGVDGQRCKVVGDLRSLFSRERQTSTVLEVRHGLPHPGGIAAEEIKQITLKVAGDLDVHGRGERLDHLADRVVAVADEAGQNIILVGGEEQLADRQSHPAGEVAGEDVAEIAGRNGKINGLAAGCAVYPAPGVEIINNLGQHACPVDGVYGAEGLAGLEVQVAEDLLDDPLAVVEGPADGEIEDVGIGDGRHLQFLDGRDAAMWMKDEDVDILLATHPVNGSTPGVAGSGAEDVHLLAPLLQQILEEVAEKLQGDILERQGRAMEQLKNVDPILMDHRHDLGVRKGTVGAIDQILEVGGRDFSGEKIDDLERQFGIGQTGEHIDIAPGQGRDRFGQQQAAVIGQTHHHRFLEGKITNLAAGALISHRMLLGEIMAHILAGKGGGGKGAGEKDKRGAANRSPRGVRQ